MALNERLTKFKQQQERLQTALSSIAASQASTPKSKIAPWVQPINSEFTPEKPPQQIKFSEDTQRLQIINSVRKSPVGAQIKLVIELLYKTRQGLTAEQINEATYVHINGNKAVFDSLRNNPKVHFDGKRFYYKSKHDLNGKDQLLSLIRKCPEGLAVMEVKDAYLTVLEDIEALKTSGEIWWVSSKDSQQAVVYPNDHRLSTYVDDDVKQLFRTIELPRDILDIEKELQKSGQPTRTNAARRRQTDQTIVHPPKTKPRKKPRGITSRTKLTNAHLPELFNDLKP
ncbi:hypothetical protein ABZP36_019855 [Zizania latifolia]